MNQPRRRSLTLANQQKSFLHIFSFACAQFFLLKGKEIFVAGFCSERVGGGSSFSDGEKFLRLQKI